LPEWSFALWQGFWGLSGYGAGLLITLFIAPIVGPQALIPMISVLMLINNASRVWFYRHAMDLKTVAKISPWRCRWPSSVRSFMCDWILR
jgi:hypothetical protein